MQKAQHGFLALLQAGKQVAGGSLLDFALLLDRRRGRSLHVVGTGRSTILSLRQPGTLPKTWRMAVRVATIWVLRV